ncbi:uncharacterized protein [Apostichopus japonicus]|uniref:uncharacterized protein isoform X1 n=1 Tax=Stichopus japonicus TaxID=307972 RepID=UPI003AB574B1
MEKLVGNLPLLVLLTAFCWVSFTHGSNVVRTTNGLLVANNCPQLGQTALNVYAIDTSNSPQIGGELDLEITKDTGLQSDSVKISQINHGDYFWGCTLTVAQPKRYKGLRYGVYEATLDSATTARTFVKRESKVLDTRGVFTVTLYPASGDPSETDLAPHDPFGVVWSPGCWQIQWCKGKRRNIYTGPKLQLSKIEGAAGIFTIRRGKRGRRGLFAQIEVIVASCPPDMYHRIGKCSSRSNFPCLNGGVGKDGSDQCTCPPPFGGSVCDEELEASPLYTGILGQEETDTVSTLRCGDLEGGNTRCKGFLFCFADLYGCKCAPGWHGNKCDRACPKGRWGADCSQHCPSSNNDCNQFRGPEKQVPPP